MNVLKKLPLIKIAALVLMVSIITSAMGFAGTYSWFMGELPLTGQVEMGRVNIELNGNTIKNTGNIDIYLRVRVIVEWKQNGEAVLGQPQPVFGKPHISGWQWTDADDGVFLAYATSDKYTRVPPNAEKTLNIPNTPPVGWEATVTLIAEAIQADGGAVEWTAGEGKGIDGVVDWTAGVLKTGGMNEDD